jgi:hypothetical protein
MSNAWIKSVQRDSELHRVEMLRRALKIVLFCSLLVLLYMIERADYVTWILSSPAFVFTPFLLWTLIKLRWWFWLVLFLLMVAAPVALVAVGSAADLFQDAPWKSVLACFYLFCFLLYWTVKNR